MRLSDGRTSSRRRGRRKVAGGIARTIVYLGLAYLFGGRYGLVAGGGIAAAWWFLAPPRWVFWAASVAMLAAAPITLLAEGVPRTPVVGGDFGAAHTGAHVLVGLAMASAGFAALTDLADAWARLRPAPGAAEGSRSSTSPLPEEREPGR
jgi:hypothetical protein